MKVLEKQGLWRKYLREPRTRTIGLGIDAPFLKNTKFWHLSKNYLQYLGLCGIEVVGCLALKCSLTSASSTRQCSGSTFLMARQLLRDGYTNAANTISSATLIPLPHDLNDGINLESVFRRSGDGLENVGSDRSNLDFEAEGCSIVTCSFPPALRPNAALYHTLFNSP